MWEHYGMVFETVADNTTIKDGVERLRREQVAMVLTGTSFNPIGLEKFFIAAASEAKIPSISVMDFWSNYALRFADSSGRLAYQPDRIAVMDESARDEMIAEGFDPTRLVVTGQPAFDDLTVWRTQFTPSARQRLRGTLGVPPDALLVLFASQPLSTVFGVDKTNRLYRGYTERTVAAALLEALERIAERRNVAISLAIRLHPREAPGALAQLRGLKVRVINAAVGEARDLAMAADLVAGITSVILVEACYLGCVTASIQPGLLERDPLPTNRVGLSYAVYQESDIEPTIEALLLDEAVRASILARLKVSCPDSCSTSRVTRLVYQMLEPIPGPRLGVTDGCSNGTVGN